MFYLYPNSAKIQEAKANYLVDVKEFIINSILKKLKNDLKTRDFCIENLEKILIGEPEILLEMHKWYICKSSGEKEIIKKIFNYTSIKHKINESGINILYAMAEKLDIRSCTYCNRNYTSTIRLKNNIKITRPQFDHYYSKKDFPFLQISFNNLIPCCSVCNGASVKGDKSMLKKDYIHPYKHNEVDNFRFSYDLLGIDNYKIKTISNHENCINTLDFFHINDVYQAHTFEIDRILKLKRAFNGTYLSMLESHLLDGIISKTEMLRILFGTELVEEKYLDMPLSKFKHDIFKELELVER